MIITIPALLISLGGAIVFGLDVFFEGPVFTSDNISSGVYFIAFAFFTVFFAFVFRKELKAGRRRARRNS